MKPPRNRMTIYLAGLPPKSARPIAASARLHELRRQAIVLAFEFPKGQDRAELIAIADTITHIREGLK